MSYKETWQKFCQKLNKVMKMSEENKSMHEDAHENIEKEIETKQEALEKELEQEENSLEAELKEEKNKFLRLYAEFENFKKRSRKEREDLIFLANESLLLDLLPVLDDFERAMKEIEKSEDKGLIDGVKLIQNKFKETLNKKHLKIMEVKAGDDFDADKHEAITQIPAPDDSMKGKIIDVVETGYILGEKVIRYPKVVVGK